MKETNYTLPEWAFIDSQSHEGNLLEGRTVIQHIRSSTIIEAIALDDMLAHRFEGSQYAFEYINKLGIAERHLLVSHFSLAEDKDIMDILQKAAQWYMEYMSWEDDNILEQGGANDN